MQHIGQSSIRNFTLAQLKAGNNSGKLKNEIRQLLCSLYRLKKYSKQSINIWSVLFKVETIFMSTQNSKTDESSKFLFEFTDKLNLKNANKNMALANLSIYYTWKNIKSEYNNNKFKISATTWNDDSRFTFKFTLNISLKNM